MPEIINIRDNQRKRLYDAERTLRLEAATDITVKFEDMKAVRRYVKKITKTAWWKKRAYILEVGVHDGRGYKNAVSYRFRRQIVLPKWARNDMIILHELTHLLIEDDCAGHGPEFAYTLVQVVQHFKGVEAAKALKAAFKKHNVSMRCKKCSVCKKGMAAHWLKTCGDCRRKASGEKVVVSPAYMNNTRACK